MGTLELPVCGKRGWMDGWMGGRGKQTWYFVRRVLQTPVTSIMATKNGIRALTAMLTLTVYSLYRLLVTDKSPGVRSYLMSFVPFLTMDVIISRKQR